MWEQFIVEYQVFDAWKCPNGAALHLTPTDEQQANHINGVVENMEHAQCWARKRTSQKPPALLRVVSG